MNCSAIVNRGCVLCPLPVENYFDAICQLVDLSAQAGMTDKPELLKEALLKRERERHTCCISRFGVPRSACDGVKAPFVAVAKLASPVKCTEGVEPITFVLLFAAPAPKNAQFIKHLACIAKALTPPENRDSLMEAENPDDLYVRLSRILGN